MFKIKFSEHAKKQMKKLDPAVARMIKHWIIKYLAGTLDPRVHGKMLTGNLSGVWRYRVGDYRLFAEINDKEITIFIVASFPHPIFPGRFQFLYLHIKRNPLSQHMSSKNFREGQFLEDICWLLNAQGRKYKN